MRKTFKIIKNRGLNNLNRVYRYTTQNRATLSDATVYTVYSDSNPEAIRIAPFKEENLKIWRNIKRALEMDLTLTLLK